MNALPRSRINGVPVHVPRALEGVAPVSPHEADFAYEAYSWLGLSALLEQQPGPIVYDCGAAHGIVSLLLARRAAVHAFEANPEMEPLARELFAANEVSVIWNAVCVGEHSRGEVAFYCAPGAACVASSRHQVVARVHPGAAVRPAPLLALDDYAAARGHLPDILKLDVEGSEWVALQGARRILATRRPDLVIETHPRQMVGEGASLQAMCLLLEELGYPLFDLTGGERITARGFSLRYAALPGCLLASERLREARFLQMLVSAHALAGVPLEARLAQARRDPVRAVPLLETILRDDSSHAEAHYLLAFALHTSKIDLTRAGPHYERALALGFPPFWVHYHWGALLLDQGNRAEARRHLEEARRLNPSHSGTPELLRLAGSDTTAPVAEF